MPTWNSMFEVGVKSVDEQHKGLIEKVDELQTAMRQGKGREKISGMVSFLGEYAVKHFTTEEALMRLFAYPKMAEHKGYHEEFKADFAKLARDVSSATATTSALAIEVQTRLSDWLVRHIQKVDKETASFLVAKGAK